MTEHDDGMIKRHEDHFTKIFDYIDDFRNNYVRSPTFVVTLISCIISIAALSGWVFTMAFSGIDKNTQSIMELARQQVRLEEKQNSIKENQQKTITQLIEALKTVRPN